MIRNICHTVGPAAVVVAVAGAAVMAASLFSPSVAAPIQPPGLALPAKAPLLHASFSGWPYPYGYTYSRRCARHDRVYVKQGRHGRWVCRG
jgi:hypothetical protein